MNYGTNTLKIMIVFNPMEQIKMKLVSDKDQLFFDMNAANE